MWAAYRVFTSDTVRLLISMKADLNVQDNTRNTGTPKMPYIVSACGLVKLSLPEEALLGQYMLTLERERTPYPLGLTAAYACQWLL